jgi:hypothetical protein
MSSARAAEFMHAMLRRNRVPDRLPRARVRRRISIHGDKSVPEYYTSIIRPLASLMPTGTS